MAEEGVHLGPPETEEYEILLPITVLELSDDDFLKSEDEELAALEENPLFLTSGKAEVVKKERAAEGVIEEHLNEGPLRVTHRGEQETLFKVTKKECDEEVPDSTYEDFNMVSFQSVLGHSDPGQNKIMGLLDPRMHNRTKKEDMKISDFEGDHNCGQMVQACLNTQNEVHNSRTDVVIKRATVVSQQPDPVADRVVWESLPELPAVDLERSTNYKGIVPLQSAFSENGKRPRRNSALRKETYQGHNAEEYPNVADENEQGASSLVNGNCHPGDFPEDAKSLKNGCTNPEPNGYESFVLPEVAGFHKNMNYSNAVTDQRSLVNTLKDASLLCSKPNSISLMPIKKHAKPKGRLKCSLCNFKGTSSVCRKEHICTVHKSENDHKIIRTSSFTSSGHCHKFMKGKKALKEGRAGSSNPGKDKRGKGKPAVERKKTKSKYEKFFSTMTKVPNPSESFCCKMCSFVSSDPKEFSGHTKEHTRGPPYHCPQCEFATDDHSYYLNHLHWHAGSKLYQCNFCTYISRHFNSVVKHSYLHSGARPYSCAVCQQAFTSASSLSKHTGTHSKEQESNGLQVARGKVACPPKTYVCHKCGIVFYTQALLQSHEKYHLQGKGHDAPTADVKKCKMQGAAYEQADGFQEGEVPKPDVLVWKKSGCFQCPYSCDQCGLVLHKEEHIVYHKAVHGQVQPTKNVTCNGQKSRGDRESPDVQSASGVAVKLFKCLQCAYVTSSFSNLRIHFATHTGEKPFKCHECDKSFRNSSHLKRHRLLHVLNRHRCSRCLFRGSTVEDLKLHEKACKDKRPATKPLRSSALRCEGSGEKINGKTKRITVSQGSRAHSYKCEHCTYSAYTLDNLKVHTRIHTGEKPYACDVCRKKFRTSSSLKRHTLVHQNREFNCNTCDYSSGTWQSFKRHLASHENSPLAAKIHKCEKCNYSTVRKENLKIHFRIHTGEKPYKCPHCGRAFRTSGHLKKHLPTHVKLQCNKCDFSTLDKHSLQKHAQTHKKKKGQSKDVYKCNKCMLTFSMLRIFTAHKKKHKESEKKK